MAKWQAVMLAAVTAALLAGGRPAAAADDVWLASGGRLRGDLELGDLVLETPQGAYRVSRDRVWRLGFDAGPSGDWVDLRNGSRVSGRLDRGRYAVRVPAGDTHQLERSEIAMIVLGPPAAPATVRTPDVLILRNGDIVYGDLAPAQFDLSVPTGTHRFARDAVSEIDLDTVAGDRVQLVDGSRLSGLVEVPRYEVRTADGQTLAFARGEVRTVLLHAPARPRAATGATSAAAAVPGGAAGAGSAASGPAALPPAIRAVLRDLHFEFDRWELTPEARRSLDELAAAMKAYPRLHLLIEGHADERGTSEYNLALGARRAESARDYLVSQGIEPNRLETSSFGEERPVDPAHNELAWALNRRAHFVVKTP